ncbi:MAG: hypothetical protein NZO58_01665 [Gemmataceae bacterium]|nr:hypothetical protein [Gemmataceae bacterium]
MRWICAFVTMRWTCAWTTLAATGLAAPAQEDLWSLPKNAKPIPATRGEMKQALSDLRDAKPRLPLPPDDGSGKGVNNGRMRAFYVPAELRGGGVGGFGFSKGKKPEELDKKDQADFTFNTKLFWIVCRVNNCQYCLGHQENKLASAGVPEDLIAALDGDWSEFSEKERAAFAFARKLTFQPHLVGRDDIELLQKHYAEAQILAMISSIAGFNAMNRWTDGLAIPQERHRDFLTPVSAKYQDKTSRVALLPDRQGLLPPAARRPAPPQRPEIDQALAECRKQTTWVALASEEAARRLLPEEAAAGPVPNWVRLYAAAKNEGRIKGYYLLADKGSLDAKLRAQINWIAAHHDRAWYALGQAEQRLRQLGETPQAIAALAGAWDQFAAKDQAVFRLVRRSTVAPMTVSDDDFVALRREFSDTQVAEIVHRICEAAYFNRVTLAAQLPLEP